VFKLTAPQPSSETGLWTEATLCRVTSSATVFKLTAEHLGPGRGRARQKVGDRYTCNCALRLGKFEHPLSAYHANPPFGPETQGRRAAQE